MSGSRTTARVVYQCLQNVLGLVVQGSLYLLHASNTCRPWPLTPVTCLAVKIC